MLRSNRELWSAFFAALIITGIYLFVTITWQSIPSASGLFGHSIGIAGFILMLMTEILYSLRKRSRSARWGRMSTWLQFHIFTGLVGPYMVLLHSSWKFNGLAGLVMLLTVFIVLSGFVGRYIYTAVPRTVDGVEIASDELERGISAIEAQLAGLKQDRPAVARWIELRLAPSAGLASGTGMIFTRGLVDLKTRWLWWVEKLRMPPEARPRARQLEALLRRRDELEREVRSLAAARRLLSLWHAVHIPIGMLLFSAAVVHSIAAFYYATLLR